MSKKRKRKQARTHKNFQIVSHLTPYCDRLALVFSLIASTPVDFTLEKLSTMPFKLIDKNFEKYGVVRCFDIDVTMETPLLTCFYRSNTIIAPNQATIEKVSDMIFQSIPVPPTRMSTSDCLMTLFGSHFLKTIGVASNRMREYQIYMNSVSTVQLPVPEG